MRFTDRLIAMHIRFKRESGGQKKVYWLLILERVAGIFLYTRYGQLFLYYKKYFKEDDLLSWYLAYLLLSSLTLLKTGVKRKMCSATHRSRTGRLLA